MQRRHKGLQLFSCIHWMYHSQAVVLEVQYEVHIQYQPDAKLDIAHFQHNWFSGWSVPNKQYVFHYNSNSPAMIPTYGKILSVIEEVLWDLVEEYQGIGKSLQDLVEGQKRNTAQLARIEAVVEQKQSFKEDTQDSNEKNKEKDGNNEEGFKDEPEESQEEVEKGTLLFASC